MKKLDIYDPALCCSTGVCGPSPDAQLTAFASAVSTLKDRLEVNRYNLAQQPGAFADSPVVNQVLQDEGPDALPIVLIDGKLVMKGIYPTGEQLAQLLGIEPAEDCCAESTDCCEGEDEGEGDCCATEEPEADKSDCCGGGSPC